MFKFLHKTLLTILFAAFASQASAMFIQPDTYDVTVPGVGTNRYAYSSDDPVNLSDPGGHVPDNWATEDDPIASDSSGWTYTYNGDSPQNGRYNSANDHSLSSYSIGGPSVTSTSRYGEYNGSSNTVQFTDRPGPTWDPVTNSRIAQLHPNIRSAAISFINSMEVRYGVQLRVAQGFRTFDDQAAIYAQGRTTPGNIVTNARAGESYHNYGLAIDVLEIDNGAANWDPDWDPISNTGKSFGFSWGGDWRHRDIPHFERTYGLSPSDLRTLIDAGIVDSDGYAIIH